MRLNPARTVNQHISISGIDAVAGSPLVGFSVLRSRKTCRSSSFIMFPPFPSGSSSSFEHLPSPSSFDRQGPGKTRNTKTKTSHRKVTPRSFCVVVHSKKFIGPPVLQVLGGLFINGLASWRTSLLRRALCRFTRVRVTQKQRNTQRTHIHTYTQPRRG